MYTAVSKRIYTTSEATYAENVTKCIDKARKIGKKKKAELELKLICLLLIAGNIFVLVNTGERIMNFFGYCIESMIVLSALFIVTRGVKNMFSFFKNS